MANEQEKTVIASANAQLRQFLVSSLSDRGYLIAGECADGAEAIRQTRRLQPDLLVIDEDLQGLRGFDVASIFVEEEIAPVLFLTRTFSPAVYHKSAKTTYFHALLKPVDSDTLGAAAAFLLNTNKRIRKLEKEISQLREKESVNHKIWQAKRFLMEKLSWSETEAHRYLQKESMKSGLPIGDIANNLLKEEANGKIK